MKLTFESHITELRGRLIWVFCFFILSCSLCWFFKDRIFECVISPLQSVMPDVNFIYTNVAEGFFTYLKLTFSAGLLATIPVIIWHIYFFVMPGLIGFERLAFRILLVPSIFLSWGAAFFVHRYVAPRAFEFFLTFGAGRGQYLQFYPKISEYISFMIDLVIGFTICFFLPIILIAFNIAGLLPVAGLIKNRKIAILVIFILAAILTPPDVASQIGLAIPMILLYELVIIICRFVERKKDAGYKMD